MEPTLFNVQGTTRGSIRKPALGRLSDGPFFWGGVVVYDPSERMQSIRSDGIINDRRNRGEHNSLPEMRRRKTITPYRRSGDTG